jgi:tetratricopeptide (TPR) repeat protein
VETGIVGLVLIGALFLYIISAYVLQYFKNEESEQDDSVLYFLLALSVLIHSLIDFEMSYAFFCGLVFLCLGILSGKQVKPIFGGLSIKSQQWTKRVVGLVWGIVAVALLVYVSNQLYSNGKFQTSMKLIEQGEPFEKIVQTLNTGLKRSPDHPFLLERLGILNLSAYEQTKDTKYSLAAGSNFDRINEVEPNARWLVNDRYSLAKDLGQADKGISILEEAITRYPYELSFYEQAIIDRFALWQKYSTEKDSVQKLDQEKHILSLYNEVKRRVEGLKTLNKAIIFVRPFKITDKMQEIVDQMGK